MRRLVGTFAVVLGVLGLPATAHADKTVIVPGTSFPAGEATYLTYFGCTDLYHASSQGPVTSVVRDAGAPAGRRATNLAMAGTGTATGPVSRVKSVATATSLLSVDAPAGGQGVAYVWFVSPELEPGEVWAGRADLAAAGGGWGQVDTAAVDYTWSRLDAASGTVLDAPGTDTIADFTDEHGDGPGYLLAGFGCDGQEFRVDRIRVGTPGRVTTYDLEGWQVSTAITTSQEETTPGEKVRVTGTSVDPWDRVAAAPMQLEARPEGAASFEPVGKPAAPDADGTVATTVSPEVTTDYRWVFAETAYADEHRSAVARITVTPLPEPPVEQEPEPDVTEPPDGPVPGGEGESSEEPEEPEEPAAPPVPDLPSGEQVEETPSDETSGDETGGSDPLDEDEEDPVAEESGDGPGEEPGEGPDEEPGEGQTAG